MLQQINQYFERLAFDLRVDTVYQEFMSTFVQDGTTEMPAPPTFTSAR
jgi:hypothetical protein